MSDRLKVILLVALTGLVIFFSINTVWDIFHQNGEDLASVFSAILVFIATTTCAYLIWNRFKK